MCAYEGNIKAGAPWDPGTVIQHIGSGSVYTVVGDDRLFSHAVEETLQYVRASGFDKSAFRVLA